MNLINSSTTTTILAHMHSHLHDEGFISAEEINAVANHHLRYWPYECRPHEYFRARYEEEHNCDLIALDDHDCPSADTRKPTVGYCNLDVTKNRDEIRAYKQYLERWSKGVSARVERIMDQIVNFGEED
jgi:hypothetical protein